jgi:hypothetical protein
VYTALTFLGQTAPNASPALVDNATIQLLQFALIGLGALLSLYAAYRIAHSNYARGTSWATLAPYAALIVLLGVVNLYLFMLPMAMRM